MTTEIIVENNRLTRLVKTKARAAFTYNMLRRRDDGVLMDYIDGIYRGLQFNRIKIRLMENMLSLTS